MLLGESQAWSRAASGWAKRSFLVRLSYAFKALLKIGWKVEVEDDEPVGGVRDMTVGLRTDSGFVGLRITALPREKCKSDDKRADSH
jgi:hypothetical protein